VIAMCSFLGLSGRQATRLRSRRLEMRRCRGICTLHVHDGSECRLAARC